MNSLRAGPACHDHLTHISMDLTHVVANTFSHVDFYLEHIDNERYNRPLEVFSGSSLGQHTRHIIEFFDCLIRQVEQGRVNYDLRLRDRQIERDTDFASICLSQLLEKVGTIDLETTLFLEQGYGAKEEETILVGSTFARELVYNIEHAIHHLAIIKIGLRQIAPEVILPEGFGVAPSTIRHEKKTVSH